MELKKITLEQARAILSAAAAVVLNNKVVSHQMRPPEEDGQWLRLAWDDELFVLYFDAGANPHILGRDLLLKDTEGGSHEITVLVEQDLSRLAGGAK